MLKKGRNTDIEVIFIEKESDVAEDCEHEAWNEDVPHVIQELISEFQLDLKITIMITMTLVILITIMQIGN